MNTNDTHSDDHGVVYKKTSGYYTVHANGRVINCTLSAHLHIERMHSTYKQLARPEHTVPDSVAVGDIVRYIQYADGSGSITAILPRRNRLARRSPVPMPTAHAHEQVIVSNVDQVVPVFSAAHPTPRWNLLDRYLVSSESLGIPALICMTKTDLLDGEDEQDTNELFDTLADYRRIGYTVVLTSTVTGQGMDELLSCLAGKTNVLVGKSGVGKSSILNFLQPGLGLRVNEVSRYKDRGKHTTTHLEMFPLELGGAIVDTPGIREFGLWDIDSRNLALYFPEIRLFAGQCRFGLSCRHDEEPGCAVRQAVARGQVSPRRYMSLMRMCEDE
ncbi:MAG: ribosome small subunit-dependent GTPase A [Anaerolineaceae bacterium]